MVQLPAFLCRVIHIFFYIASDVKSAALSDIIAFATIVCLNQFSHNFNYIFFHFIVIILNTSYEMFGTFVERCGHFFTPFSIAFPPFRKNYFGVDIIVYDAHSF